MKENAKVKYQAVFVWGKTERMSTMFFDELESFRNMMAYMYGWNLSPTCKEELDETGRLFLFLDDEDTCFLTIV